MDNKPRKRRSPSASLKQENDNIAEMISRHVSILSEHLSSVQIVGTKVEADGCTSRFTYGSGDLCARIASTELCSISLKHKMLSNG
jgi:hypothetical protein